MTTAAGFVAQGAALVAGQAPGFTTEVLLQLIAGFVVGRFLRGGAAAAFLGASLTGPLVGVGVLGGDIGGGFVASIVMATLLFMPGYLLGDAARPRRRRPDPGQPTAHEASIQSDAIEQQSSWSISQMSIHAEPYPSEQTSDERGLPPRTKVIVAVVMLGSLVLVGLGMTIALLQMGP